MILFDIILLIILAGFVGYGLYFGLIRALGSLLGFVIGLWLAVRLYLIVFGWLENLFFSYNTLGKIVVFLLLFTLINRLVCFIFAVADRAFDLISIIPFLKTINRLAGAIFGFIEGGLVLGLAIYLISQSSFNGVLNNSQFALSFGKFIELAAPFFPGLLEKVKVLL